MSLDIAEKALDLGGLWGPRARQNRLTGFADTMADMLQAAPEAELEQALTVKRQNNKPLTP